VPVGKRATLTKLLVHLPSNHEHLIVTADASKRPTAFERQTLDAATIFTF
jgi:hypothetical protein